MGNKTDTQTHANTHTHAPIESIKSKIVKSLQRKQRTRMEGFLAVLWLRSRRKAIFGTWKDGWGQESFLSHLHYNSFPFTFLPETSYSQTLCCTGPECTCGCTCFLRVCLFSPRFSYTMDGGLSPRIRNQFPGHPRLHSATEAKGPKYCTAAAAADFKCPYVIFEWCAGGGSSFPPVPSKRA